MTSPVETALVAAAEAGAVPTLDDLGDFDEVSSEVLALAASPLAPLAAQALSVTVSGKPEAWGSTVSEFAAALSMQTSRLALADAVDTLLDTPAVAGGAAAALHDALLADHRQTAQSQPLLAVTRIETALRVALTGTVAPYRVLEHLAEVDPGSPEGYLETLPRLIGIALDRWDDETTLTAPLVAALVKLRDIPSAAAGAAHELACSRMRAALRETDPDNATAGLAAAADAFTNAATLDEARDDASVYAAVCAAVAAFGTGDADRLRELTPTLSDVVRQRVAWHRNMHQPRWREPILDAEVEWLGLVVDLREATDRLAERSWLESASAVGQLARAYSAERSTSPAPGLAAVVRPVIVNAVAEKATLLDQLARTITADRERDVPALPAAADALLAAIRERRTQGHRRTDDEDDGADAEGDPALDARIDEVAPRLRLLGDDVARAIARAVDDNGLAEAELVIAATTASGVMEHPALAVMRANIISELSGNLRFDGETRAVVIGLLDATLTFLLDKYNRGGRTWPGHADICRRLQPGETPPLEEHLQWEFYIWLDTCQPFAGRADVERRDVSRGRVDVLVRVGEIQLVTEVKRELANASRDSLERLYIPQALTYSGSNVPFSQLLVLDLTDHASGVAHLRDLAWVVERRADDDATPQHVVAAVVVGNRPAPSALKASPSLG